MILFRHLAITLIFTSIIFCGYSQETVVDNDGNSYSTIKIGNQLWMAENLNTIHYANGDTINSFCYDNDTGYCKIYGRLYTWEALKLNKKQEKSRGICPENWHVPSDEEWKIMIDSVGGFSHAGTILRHGKYSDFNLKWGGNYHSDLEIFSFIDRKTYFWTATEYNKNVAWMRMTGSNTKNVNRSTAPKEYAFSIRCVKN